MSQYCVPYLVVNYGAEMIFILEQRLNAQAVRGEKSTKVLQDVSNALFSKTFVDELVLPQLLYSQQTTREIFDRLAHSSIMRLSEPSMSKLYDLMTMGVKYQLVACRVPRDLARLTAMRLDCVRLSVKSTETNSAADAASKAVNELSQTLGDGQMQDVRHSLLNFFHGRRNKISLLMTEGLQLKTGALVVQRGGVSQSEVPYVMMPVGQVAYFDNGAAQPTRVETLNNHPDIALELRSPADVRLGRNMYVSDKPKGDGVTSPVASPTKPASAAASPAVGTTSYAAPAASPSRKVDDSFRVMPIGKRHFAPAATSSSAVTTLTNFIVRNAPKETIKIQNLFDEPASGAGAAAAGSSGVDVIHITKVSRDALEKANAELLSVRDSFVVAESKAAAGADNDDLLDLLDSA